MKHANRTIGCLMYLLGGALLLHSQALTARPAISFTCSLPEAMPYRLELEKVYTELFDSLGYDFSMSSSPVSRGLAMLDAGLADGDCSRSETLLDNTGELSVIKVNVVIRSTDYGLWSHSAAAPEFISISDLRERNTRIGYSKGSLVIEHFLKNHQLANVVPVAGLNNGLRMLGADRFDFYLVGNGLVYEQLDTLDLRSPIYLKGILFQDRSYLYLHRKHRDIKAAVEAKLRKLLPAGGVPVASGPHQSSPKQTIDAGP
jgi:hypothetical protein